MSEEPTPIRELKEGESIQVTSTSGKTYTLKRILGVYSCTCLGWLIQKIPIDKRTCKHLKEFRGEAAEIERVGYSGSVRRVASSKSSGGKKRPFPVMLAQHWDSSYDPTGWYISEKLDGVRAYWSGSGLFSRQGNKFNPPDFFLAEFPPFPLDGEIFLARQHFDIVSAIVRSQAKDEHWRELNYLVFDAPKEPGGFEERIAKAREWFTAHEVKHARVLDQVECKGMDHLMSEFERIVGLGGEGVMLRAPGSVYVDSRTDKMLKLKPLNDAECIVTGHVKGKGKFDGLLGALEVKLPDGTPFRLGSGFSEDERTNPPKIGSVVTFRYQELTEGGVPRFPIFLRLRDDVTWNDIVLDYNDQNKRKEKRNSVDEQKEREPIGKMLLAEASPAKAKRRDEPAAFVPSDIGKTYRYEMVEGTSAKFWEITIDKLSYTVQYGRIGTNGQVQLKEWGSESETKTEADKIRHSKEAKGYILQEK